MKTSRIGGSVLPSSSPIVLIPIECSFGKLQVRALAEVDTHALTMTTERGTSILATHSNGHSCYALAKRLISGDAKKVKDQVEYILSCGGTAKDVSYICELISNEGA